jgi:subtilase family serine protease
MRWKLRRAARLGATGAAVNSVGPGTLPSAGLGDRFRACAVLATATVVAAVAVLASGCTSSSPAPAPVSLPVSKTGEITFYLSLPASTAALDQAATKAGMPGSPTYRHFISLATAASRFGATDARIEAIAKSVQSLGLQYAADPTRLFARVTGSAKQWQAALGTPLTEQAATASNPFTTYTLPARTPASLQPSGTVLLLNTAQVYDPAAEGQNPPPGNGQVAEAGTAASEPWPHNTGTPFTAGCSTPALQLGDVYTEQQIQTAYGVGALRARASGTPVITIMDLGGGWLPSDLKLAGECFGYSPPRVDQTQGDGVPTAISDANPETSLDLQTASAVAPQAQFRLVQATPGGGGILDGFSRALTDPDGIPDVISLSYGGCALAENTAAPAFTSAIDAVLAMAALAGVSSFAAAGDAGSTVCGTRPGGTTLSYPAVSPFVTAVGGTRLTLGKGNVRVSETVWNDSAYGVKAAGGGALSRREPRPPYQDGFVPQNRRALPDVSALADIIPGWPDVLDGTLQAVGGTSGSTPFVAAATALVDGSQRAAGRPRIGPANGWFYNAASHPGAFFDITTGSNDLDGVGCCQATVGYDLASGLGVPNWGVLPATLPPPG